MLESTGMEDAPAAKGLESRSQSFEVEQKPEGFPGEKRRLLSMPIRDAFFAWPDTIFNLQAI